jgi:hypothetical protein
MSYEVGIGCSYWRFLKPRVSDADRRPIVSQVCSNYFYHCGNILTTKSICGVENGSFSNMPFLTKIKGNVDRHARLEFSASFHLG